MVSAVSQWVGGQMNTVLKASGLAFFDKGTCTTVFVTVLGLICAMTRMGKLPAVNELSNVYLYAIVALLASTATLVDLVAAPMWVVYGIAVLAIHIILMFLLSKLFHWDLCMCSTASVACIGGSASAPIIATAYDGSFAGIGVLMGVLGVAVGNFCGLGMGAAASVLHVILKRRINDKQNKTSIVFTGDIGFDRYMDRRWEDDNLLSGPILDFFHSADHTVANVEGALIDAVDDGSRGIFFHSMNPAATRVLKLAHADIWSIGNNHTMDAGREGVISTKNIAKRWDAVPSAPA